MPPAPSGLAGRLLVSHPSLRDDNFRESVVLLHSPAEGAMGVIINRPMQSVLADASPVLAGTPLAGMPLFQGGPVSADRFAIGGWRWLSAVDAELRYGLERRRLRFWPLQASMNCAPMSGIQDGRPASWRMS